MADVHLKPWIIPDHIKITTYNDMPFSGAKLINGTWHGEGIAFQILNLMIKQLNFTYEIRMPEQNIIGDENHGVMGMVAQNKVDMAVAFIPMLIEFTDYANFSYPLDMTDLRFLMARPGASATGYGTTAPFSKLVWQLSIALMITMGNLLYLFNRLRCKYKMDPFSHHFTYPRCMWWCYSASLRQGTTASPIAEPTRWIFGSWWLFCTVMTCYYTANMTAVFTRTKFTLPIHSLQDMVNDNYEWFTQEGNTIDTMLRHDKEEIRCLKRSLAWRYGKIVDYNISNAEVLHLVEQKKVYLVEGMIGQHIFKEHYNNHTNMSLTQIQRCLYMVNPEPLLEFPRTFPLSKTTPFFGALANSIRIISEQGHVKHYKSLKAVLAPACPRNLKIHERRLQVSDMGMTLRFMVRGYTVATVIFFVEIVVFLIHTFYKSIYFKKIFSGPFLFGNSSIDPSYNQFYYSSEFDQNNYTGHSPPPKYRARDALAAQAAADDRIVIDGKEYYIVRLPDGERRMVPVKNNLSNLFEFAKKQTKQK